MKKLIVLAAMIVLPFPAFAAIQNVKVSGDITTSWIGDESLDLGSQTAGVPNGQKTQNVFITQTRLRVDADLSDNVSATVGLINERAWNAESCNNAASSSSGIDNLDNGNCDTNVQLYLANVTMRELLYSPLTVTIGRQVFNYGNGFILGDGGPINSGAANLLNIYADLNERTAYDGVTATLDYKPLTISLIYFKNGEGTKELTGNYEGGTNSNFNDSSEVAGYNANYQLNDPWGTVVEQYLFTRTDEATLETNNKGNQLFVPGLRGSTNPTKNLTLQGEIAWELGDNVVNVTSGNVANQGQQAEKRSAMAAQVMASYALPVLDKYKPTVNASWTYASGDKDADETYRSGGHFSSDKTYTAWDEFNTIQGAGTIYRALFPMSDEDIVSVGGTVNPLEDVTLGATWSGIWAPAAYNSTENQLVMLQPDGTTVTPATKNGASGIGNETDLNLTYNYTEDVTFGVTVGWFVPGSVFSTNNRDTASQAIANVGVKF